MELGPGTDLGFYITPPSALSAVKVLICWAVFGSGLVWRWLWLAGRSTGPGVLEKVPALSGPLGGGLSVAGLLGLLLLLRCVASAGPRCRL